MSRYSNMLVNHINQQLSSHGVAATWNKFNSQQLHTTGTAYAPKTKNISQEKTSYSVVPKSEDPCVEVTSEAMIDCTNIPYPISALSSGVVAKIPVIIAELTVQINLSSNITLPEWVIDIKESREQLTITQCTLIQSTNILFIKGCVKKDIQYIAKTNNHSIGNSKNISVDIPFKCSTTVSFNGTEPAPLVANDSCEYKIDFNKDDLSHINQATSAFYNEQPFCELTSSRIISFDELSQAIPFPDKKHNIPISNQINKIEEQIVLYLTLKILQYRPVKIPPYNN